MPCYNTVPISVIPPVGQGQGTLVWQNGNQIARLVKPSNPSWLVYDGSSVRWGDGSAQAPVYLPNIQEVNGPTLTYVAGITSTGQLVKTLGASGTALVGGSAGKVVYQTGPSATGFTAVGTTGQVLSSNGSSAPTWLNQSALSVGNATNVNGGTVSATTGTFSSSLTATGANPIVTCTPSSPNGLGGFIGNGTNAVSSIVSQIQLYATASVAVLNQVYNLPLLFFTNNTQRMSIAGNGVIDTNTNPITNCPTTAQAKGSISASGTLASGSYGITNVSVNSNVFTVESSAITATSVILVTPQAPTTSGYSPIVVPSAGSCTVRLFAGTTLTAEPFSILVF